jgi:hypothetical protein
MSKDKGTKNHKKPPADKSSGKGKAVSAYKSESKSGNDLSLNLNTSQKPDIKKEGSKKS